MGTLVALVLFAFLWVHLGKRIKAQAEKLEEYEAANADLADQLAALRRHMHAAGVAPKEARSEEKAQTEFDKQAEAEGLPWSKKASDERPKSADLEEILPGEAAAEETFEIEGEQRTPPGDEVEDRALVAGLLTGPEPATAMLTGPGKTEPPEPSPEIGKPDYAPWRPSSDTAEHPQSDLEQRLSTNWLVWIGGIALALAGIFLVRYIAEQGWLSPAMRCGIGVIFGLALIVAGEIVRRRPMEKAIAALRPDYVPQALTGAGLATAFGSIYLAYAFYQLIPSGWSFAALAGITLAAFVLSLVQGRFVALLGLAGATATPALISTDDPSNWGFFSYLGIVVLATLAVADRRRWYWLPQLSLITLAGWEVLWILQTYRDADILPIGVTVGIVALGALIMARRALADPANGAPARTKGLSGNAEDVAWTALMVAVGSAFALALLSDFHPSAHWVLLSFVVAGAFLARLMPRFDWTLVALTLLSVIAFGLVYLDETAIGNLSERIMGWPAPTEYLVTKYGKFSLHAPLIAAALFTGGVQALGRSSQPRTLALVTSGTPLALLVIGYAQFRNYSGDAIWVWAALATLLAALAATILLRRSMRDRVDLHGLYAAVAVIAAFLALTFQFDRIWLTLAYAALVLVVSVASTRADYTSVRNLVNLIVLVILARLTINPDLRGYEIFHPLGMQWVTYGYLVPLALFFTASRLLKRVRDDLSVTVLEGAALLLAIVFVSIEIRIYMTGAIYSGSYELPEASLQTIAWLTSALVLARRDLRHPRIFSKWGARILTVAGVLQALTLQLALMNPFFTGEFIDGHGLFNILILSLLAPAILIWLIAGSLLPGSGKTGAVVTALLRGISGLLIFAFVTEEIRVFFQGMVIRPAHASLLELYVTTLGWLLPASAPYLFKPSRATGEMRGVALIVMLFSLMMLLLGHAWLFNPALTGETVRGWPVFNTLLLGFIAPAFLLYAVGKASSHPDRILLTSGAYLLILVWVWLAIKNAFQGGRMILLHESLLELYVTTLCWLVLGALPFFFRRIGQMAEAERAGYAALALSVAMLFGGHTVIFNPVFDKSFVAGWPVFNVLLLGFVLPGALLALTAGRIDDALRPALQIAAYVLLFFGITMLVKHAFQGPVLSIETLTDIEDYGYSAAWLMLALVTMAAGILRDNGHLRYASLTVLLLVVLKVFLLDMSGLAGLWRVASFFGLGIALVGIGYVYQHFVYARQARAAPSTPEAQET